MTLSAILIWIAYTTLLAALLCQAIYERWLRPRRSAFRSNDIVLKVDHAHKLLRIQLGDASEATAKLTHCHITSRDRTTSNGKGAHVGSVRFIVYELDSPHCFHQRWARHPSVTLTSTETWVASFDMRQDTTALQRWIEAHRNTLFPSEHAIRRAWEQSCDKLLTACRHITLLRKLNTPLELFDYSTIPAIRYLAIGEDGRACLKALEHAEFHELDLRDLALDRCRLWITLPNGEKERFTLNGGQLAHLQRIQQSWLRRHEPLPGLRTHLWDHRPLACTLIRIHQRDVAYSAA
jgi:hypothetical protein